MKKRVYHGKALFLSTINRFLLKIFIWIFAAGWCGYFLLITTKNSIVIESLIEIHLKQTKSVINMNYSASFLQKNNSNGTKIILLWNSLFPGLEFLEASRTSFQELGCPEIRCEITSDRRRLKDSHAVLFHARTTNVLDLPRHRSSSQKWIFFSLEAPPYSHFQGLHFMQNMFNWTMTYRMDSDVPIPYGRVLRTNTVKTTPVNSNTLYDVFKGKTEMAVWMASHCSTNGNREGFVRQLQQYVDIDTFGECGIAVCPFNRTNDCMSNYSRKFFFYLAFENSICNGYISEKLFRSLKYDMIPIVFGGGSYSQVAPPHSFINAMDFRTPHDLAEYMYLVSSNFTLFLSYFTWRLEAAFVVQEVSDHCALCQKLHSASFNELSVYRDIAQWWVKESRCRRWDPT